jgi:glucosamine--fructose-6-phosphate aminotransferase (isomerizing)
MHGTSGQSGKENRGEIPQGHLGIGHTRWATHGRPSDTNAHPHADCHGDFVVVHNGIVENYLNIKERLMEKGHKFVSETDTEVVAHLVEEYYEGDFVEAVKKVLAEIRGSYSLVFISRHEPDKIICTKQDNPLVIGLGEGENFIASDIPAIIHRTRRTFILSDGEMAVVTKDSVWVTNRQGTPVSKKVFEVNWDAEAAEKGGYDHFMIKEIAEQPKAFRDTMTGRVNRDTHTINFDELKWSREEVSAIKKIMITACGTAYHAGLVGKYYLEQLARIPVEVDYCVRVSLPESIGRFQYAGHHHQPVRRDQRFPGGAEGSQAAGRPHSGGDQCRRFLHRPRSRSGHLHLGRPGNCGGVHQGLYDPAAGDADGRPVFGRSAGKPADGTLETDCGGTGASAAKGG